MLDRLIRFSVRARFIVLLLTLVGIGIGIEALRRLPIDAVPDVTNVQVQVLTRAPALGALEIEQLVTFPVELAMSGLPGVRQIRSISRFGLSHVTIVFSDDTDIYFARQLVAQRLGAARESIPAGYGVPELGPISSGLGEIYQLEVRGDGRAVDLMTLRTVLDWQIAPRLRMVPGVVEVNSYGGLLKAYEVQLDPDKLTAQGLSLGEVFRALERNNANVGGAYIARAGEQTLIRGQGLIERREDVADIVVATREGGVPVYVRNLGEVVFAPMVRQGAVTRDGRGEIVAGITMMLLGENSREVVARVKEAVAAIKKSMPPGITIEPFYDRTDLVRKTIGTVEKNLVEGGALVIVVLFLMLRNLRAGLITACAIPLCMLSAFIGMNAFGLSGNLMSLGAIDFGLLVDGALIIVESAVRRLSERATALGRPLSRAERDYEVAAAAVEIRGAAAFGELIIAVVYLPILALGGVAGKMFRPMALTVLFALAGAFVLSLTLVPALASWCLSRRARERESLLMRLARRLYEPALRRCLGRRAWVVAVAAALLALTVLVLSLLGAEFVPRLDEGALAIQAWRPPSVSLEESVRQTTVIENVLRRFPEVITVVSKTGRAEIATDPMGVEVSDILVMLKPRDAWTSADDRDALIAKMDEALQKTVPGTLFSFAQPIEMRVAELIAGVRSDVAVAIYGNDLDQLKASADALAAILRRIPGAADVKAEQVAGLPVARIRVDRAEIARYGLNAADVLDAVETIGGKQVGVVLEGEQRFALTVRWAPGARASVEQLQYLKIASPTGQLLPLGQLAEIVTEPGPAQVSRQNLKRRITVELNVRGRDLQGFVAEAQRVAAARLPLPPGAWLEWGGQFENLREATARLGLVVPLTLLVIFVLLYGTFGAVRPALLIYLNIPFAVTGGVLALAARGLPLSISAAVGFIALFGVAVLNGLVLVAHILRLRRDGLGPEEAAATAARARLRPVLTTALVASLGFLPMALARGAGAEVQRPLATVVIGGLVSSTLLTLLVLPTVYGWFDSGGARPRPAPRRSRRRPPPFPGP